MFFTKKKEPTAEITLEWLLEVGVPPHFASIIMRRIDEILKDKSKDNKFEAKDFKNFPIWNKDKENLAKMLNSRFE